MHSRAGQVQRGQQGEACRCATAAAAFTNARGTPLSAAAAHPLLSSIGFPLPAAPLPTPGLVAPQRQRPRQRQRCPSPSGSCAATWHSILIGGPEQHRGLHPPARGFTCGSQACAARTSSPHAGFTKSSESGVRPGPPGAAAHSRQVCSQSVGSAAWGGGWGGGEVVFLFGKRWGVCEAGKGAWKVEI